MNMIPRRLIVATFVMLGLGLYALTMAAEEKKVGKAADNKIHAQTLIFQMMADNPDLLIGGMHAVAPGASGQTMIASTLDRIGAEDDEGDISVGVGGRTILVPNLKNPPRFSMMIPLKDSSGKRIGALALAFKYRENEDETKIFLRGVAIRDQVAKKIPSLADLFVPSRGN